MNDSLPEQLMTVRDVATYCNVSTQAVYQWIKDKALPVVFAGSEKRIRRAELDAWLERERPAAEGAA